MLSLNVFNEKQTIVQMFVTLSSIYIKFTLIKEKQSFLIK